MSDEDSVPPPAWAVGNPYALGPITINAGGLRSASDGKDYTLIASTGQTGGVGVVVSNGNSYTSSDGFWHAVLAASGTPCLTDAQCVIADNASDASCTCNKCSAGFCTSFAIEYGNVNCLGPINQTNLDDILCCLSGFASFAACPNADLHPNCTGNNVINLDDILGVLAAFGGVDPCNCNPS